MILEMEITKVKEVIQACPCGRHFACSRPLRRANGTIVV